MKCAAAYVPSYSAGPGNGMLISRVDLTRSSGVQFRDRCMTTTAFYQLQLFSYITKNATHYQENVQSVTLCMLVCMGLCCRVGAVAETKLKRELKMTET